MTYAQARDFTVEWRRVEREARDAGVGLGALRSACEEGTAHIADDGERAAAMVRQARAILREVRG